MLNATRQEIIERIAPLRRVRVACSTLLASMLVLSGATALAESVQVHGAPMIELRAIYQRARQAQLAGQHAMALELAKGIAGYVLYPYVIYEDLKRRLDQIPADDVARFLRREDGSLLAARLRQQWLVLLAGRDRWDLYRRDYQAQDSVELQCHYLTARLRAGESESVLTEARQIWLSGDSLPSACDPAFEVLGTSALMDDHLIAERLQLALRNGRLALAQYLLQKIREPANRAKAALWIQARQSPQSLLRQLDRSAATQREIVVYALNVLAGRNVDEARLAWSDAAQQIAFTPIEAGRFAALLARRAAADGHAERKTLLDAVPPEALNGVIEHYRIREAIQDEDWPALARWTEHPALAEENVLRWRYWQARALSKLGQQERAKALLGSLALERDYYGFLAADEIGAEYVFQHVATNATESELAKLAALPAMQRARELATVQADVDSRREWQFQVLDFDRRQLEVAAALATQWGWHDRAIAALGQARSYNDLELRFPLLHSKLATAQGLRRHVAPARVMAIIRSESAFARQARSSAGALGLMQLLPGTARETARRIGMSYSSDAQLFEPKINITLGSAYLAQSMASFGDSFVMAAAAYNAGPGRVRQWQGAQCVAADQWIELIPFDETRAYVRRALFYTALYQWRLGSKPERLTEIMKPIPARNTSEARGCNI
jgi:soluble lytic murein transglycosylase